MTTNLPSSMRALRYERPKEFNVVNVPLPQLRDNDVLIKVKACGVCGTDLHIHEGEFIAKFPLIPGHEVVGVVAAVGSKVKGFSIGERVVADNSEVCDECSFCRQGDALFCQNYDAHGATLNGAFAEYCAYPAARVFKIKNISDLDATLIEPASCAAHGVEKIAPKLGSSVLLFGAGPTGLVLAQLLRMNGASRLVLAAPPGLKLDLARQLDVADEYIPLSRTNMAESLEPLSKASPQGFDIVVEATGNAGVLQGAINYVRRGGKLVVYGVYANRDTVCWSPSKLFNDEITIVGSFAQTYMFPAAVDYLDCGRVRVGGIVNKSFRIEQWGECLQALRDKSVIKAAIVFD
ncbi:chaperonin 10-like protein [Aspergillus insuetus]